MLPTEAAETANNNAGGHESEENGTSLPTTTASEAVPRNSNEDSFMTATVSVVQSRDIRASSLPAIFQVRTHFF